MSTLRLVRLLVECRPLVQVRLRLVVAAQPPPVDHQGVEAQERGVRRRRRRRDLRVRATAQTSSRWFSAECRRSRRMASQCCRPRECGGSSGPPCCCRAGAQSQTQLPPVGQRNKASATHPELERRGALRRDHSVRLPHGSRHLQQRQRRHGGGTPRRQAPADGEPGRPRQSGGARVAQRPAVAVDRPRHGCGTARDTMSLYL